MLLFYITGLKASYCVHGQLMDFFNTPYGNDDTPVKPVEPRKDQVDE